MEVRQDKLPARIGNYRIVRRLAVGGTSDVLLARTEAAHGLERTVALKLLLPHHQKDPQFERMFALEATAYARLSHPSIVKLHDFFSTPERQVALVLEYVDGLPLSRFRALLQSINHPLDDRAAVALATCIFEGLAAAHAARDPETGQHSPVIHRDVNPSNVLIAWDGQAKLTDFGIAKVAGMPSDTRTGFVKGTFGYMAPEQVKGEEITTRTDVYAASLLLWELLARRRAIQQQSMPEYEVMRAMAHPSIVPLSVLRPDLPRALRETIQAGLEPDVRKRTLVAHEVVGVLRSSFAYDDGRARLAAALAIARRENEHYRETGADPVPIAAPKPPPVRSTAAYGQGAAGPGGRAEGGRMEAKAGEVRGSGGRGNTMPLEQPAMTLPLPTVHGPNTTPMPVGHRPPHSSPPNSPLAKRASLAPPSTHPTPFPVSPSFVTPSPFANVESDLRPEGRGPKPAAGSPPKTPKAPQTGTSALRALVSGVRSPNDVPLVPGKTLAMPGAPPKPEGPPGPPSRPPLPPGVPVPPPLPAPSDNSSFTGSGPFSFMNAPPPAERVSLQAPVADPVASGSFVVPANNPPVYGTLESMPVPQPARPRKSNRTLAIVLLLVAIGGLAALAVILLSRLQEPAAPLATNSAQASVTPSETASSPLVASVDPTTTASPPVESASAAPPPPPAAPPPAPAAPTPAPVAPPPAPAEPTSREGILATETGGHRIFVDGRLVGHGPGRFKVACGRHSVKVGSQGRPLDVDVPCGGETSVR